jgi:serine/threonine protein kinase
MLQPRAPPTLSQKVAVGSGATATVYKAFVVDGGGFSRLRPGQYVAVKSMYGLDKRRIKLIEREVAMHKSMVHPNIVNYFGFYVPDDDDGVQLSGDQSQVCILMEFCDGGSLHHLATSSSAGRIPESALRSYLYQALKGLRYLHERGIVHRDIKGLNLLLTREGQCKLGDFGAAVDLGTKSDGQFHSLQGTPFWMAPEMFEVSEHGAGGTAAADVWSIGATAWELSTGDRPFRTRFSNDFQLILYLSEMKDGECDSVVPDDLEEAVGPETLAFIRRCMRIRPQDRPTVADLMADAFFAEAAKTDAEWTASATVRAQPAAFSAHSSGDTATPLSAPCDQPGHSAPAAAPATLQLEPDTVPDNDSGLRQWLEQAVGPLIRSPNGGFSVATPPSAATLLAAEPTAAAGASAHATTSSSSRTSLDEPRKLQPALTWWNERGFRAQCSASAFFDALGLTNLQTQLFPIVAWGRETAVRAGTAECIRLTDFIRFVQFFGPFDALLSDAKELGGAADAYGGYGGYRDYAYDDDTPHLLLTWHSHPWFQPDWTQARAEEHLKNAATGDFVVRFSSRWKDSPGSYTLSVKGERGVSHYRVVRPVAAQSWAFILAPHEREVYYFDSLEELVAFCREFGVKSTKSDRVYRLL